MAPTHTHVWTDRFERGYVLLRRRGSHWNLEWGYRDPPASDNYVQQGERVTSIADEAVRWALEEVRRLTDEPDEVARGEREFADFVRAEQGEA